MHIKSLWVAGSLASALLITAPAFAAADAWQGFYAGAALGGREQQTDWKQDGKFYNPYNSEVIDLGMTAKNGAKDSATYVALYGGYNWVIGERLVAGLEVAGGYADNQSEKNHVQLEVAGIGSIPSNTDITVKTDWDASLRGRLGFLVTPSVLLYGTGGIAATRMNVSGQCTVGGAVCMTNYKNAESETLVGWTAGFGVETSLTDNLSARAEYQYSDYGSESFWAPGRTQSEMVIGVHNKVDLTSQSLTLGLAYHF